MEPRSYFTALVRGWVIILVCAIVGAAAALAFALARADSYEAKSSALVAVDVVESGSDLWQTSNATVVLASSYAELVTTPIVTEPAAQEVGDITPARLGSKVSAEVPLQSVNITVTAQDGDPARAAAIANASITSLADAIREVAPKTSEDEPAVALHITQEAIAPTDPASLSSVLLVAVGAAAGLAFGAVLALLRAPRTPQSADTTQQVAARRATDPATPAP